MGALTFAAAEIPKWTDVEMVRATWNMVHASWTLVVVTAVLAVVTGLLFSATRGMAKQTEVLARKTAEMAEKTAELASDTVAAAKKTDLHHQQSLWPYVILSAGQFDEQGIRFSVRNIGPGASPNVVVKCIEVDGIQHNGYYNVGPLGAGEVRGGGDNYFILPYLYAAERGNVDRISEATIAVAYATLFGTTGITEWKKRRAAFGTEFVTNVPPDIIDLGMPP